MDSIDDATFQSPGKNSLCGGEEYVATSSMIMYGVSTLSVQLNAKLAKPPFLQVPVRGGADSVLRPM